MPKTKAPASTQKKYASKMHRIYADEFIIDGIDALAVIENKSRSEILAQLAKRHLRSKAAKLRKSGFKLSSDIFAK